MPTSLRGLIILTTPQYKSTSPASPPQHLLAILRNRWSRSIGIPGRDPSDWVVGIAGMRRHVSHPQARALTGFGARVSLDIAAGVARDRRIIAA
jgi:hypothetical protein